MQEEILIPLIVFTFLAIVIKMTIDYLKWKRVHTHPKDEGLRVSELKALIREAMAEANEPVAARLEALEMSQEHLAALLSTPPVPPMLEDPDVAKQAPNGASPKQKES